MEQVSSNKCFGGEQRVYRHQSSSTRTDMTFGLYLPPQALAGQRVPLVMFLSGLTCSHENVMHKGGYQRACAELGLAFLHPDTSPRGDGVADDAGYDLGMGAGFYVDATEEPWRGNYRMYSYCAIELPELIEAEFADMIDVTRFGITGHSMGGHGALTIAMKHPDRFKSVSAFAPIVAPSQVPWGKKALGAYLGDDPAGWIDYDASVLMRVRGYPGKVLVDVGDADDFLEGQLRPAFLTDAAEAKGGQQLEMRLQPGYDHSYYFIATFMAEHLAHHAAAL